VLDLQVKTAIVTGAASGIGFGIAKRLPVPE
jgi:NAD(P)-dependent dehydrogenase (short-subunit alcohol dehydrogenase family)